MVDLHNPRVCSNLRRLLDRFCPPVRPIVRVRFSRPEAKTETDDLRQALFELLRSLIPGGGASTQEAIMPFAFGTSCNNTQKVKTHLALTNPEDGQPLVISSVPLSIQSGDGSFEQIDSLGNPLPPNEVYLISGSLAGDTVYQGTVFRADNGLPGQVTLTLTVGVAPEPVVSATFDAPEQK
jgi:hypothetical protein